MNLKRLAPLAWIFGLFVLLAHPLVAGTVTVDTDLGTRVDDPGDGPCSFKEALGNVFQEMQQFDDCEDPGAAPHFIVFTGVFTINMDDLGSIANIINELTIQGPVVLDGNNLMHGTFLLDAASSSNLTVNQVTFQDNGASAIRVRENATLTVNASVFDNNQANNGAAINAGGNGSVTVNLSSFTRNDASGNGGAIFKGNGCELFVNGSNFGGPMLGNEADRGGAIYISGTVAAEGVVITGSSFLGNSSDGTDTTDGGGAIYIQGATGGSYISIFGGAFGSSVPLTGNSAMSRGGAIYNNATEGLVNTDPTDILDAGIIGVEFVNNSADDRGGAIYNRGSMNLFHATFDGNSAVEGGAVADDQQVSGREFTISNSTFNGNSASADGGALGSFDSDSNVILRNVTLSGNTASTSGRELFAMGDIDLGNVLIANGSAGPNCAGTGTFIDSMGNLQWDPGSDTGCGATVSVADPLLDSLTLNPGPIPVRTMALMPGSPALGAGVPAICSALPVFMLDARGVPRPSACDSGAFEGGDSARVVINEIDYDQGATDDHEFIELFNGGAESIDLSGFTVELVNGDGGGAVVYETINTLVGTLAPGGHYVICGQTGSGVPATHCDLDLPMALDTDFMEDGDPDAVGLRLSGLLVDALSYGGADTGTPYTETAGAGDDPGANAFFGLSRTTDGVDTDDNSSDFAGRCATPGEANIPDTVGCQMVMLDPGELQFSMAAYTTAETGLATITVTRVNGADGAVSVSYATSDGSATNPADYTMTMGTLNWADGDAAAKTFDIPIAPDMLDELNETVMLALSAPTGGAVLGTPATATLTITDDDLPPLVSIGDVTQVEGNAGTSTFDFAVTLDAASGRTITVDFGTTDGSATTADNDYVAASGTVTFTPGDIVETASVTVNGDPNPEADENFVVDLSTPINVTISDGQGEGTILDDDTVPSFSVDDVMVTEGNAGTVTLGFTVSLSPTVGSATSIDVATADDTATAGSDYVALGTTTVNFPANSGSQVVQVTVNGDLLDETDETLFLNLTNPQGGTAIYDAQGVGTITDDDLPPNLSIGDLSMAEGNAGATNFDFAVNLDAPSGQQVDVDFATTDGTATTADSDYVATVSSVSIPAGMTLATATVPVNGDTNLESDEDFTVTLSAPVNAGITDAVATGTILDDDTVPSFSVDDVMVLEGNAGTVMLQFTVSVSPTSASPISVDAATSDNTATAPADYTALITTVNFPANSGAQTVSVEVQGDLLDENDETLFLDLSNPSAGTTIVDGQGIGTITDDDLPPNLSIGDLSLPEGNAGTTSFVFTVVLDQASGLPVSVDWSTADGTATIADNDYQLAMGAATFAPGSTMETVTVLVNGDGTPEANETFFVDLANPLNAGISDAQAEGTIVDDDSGPVFSIDDILVAEGNAGTVNATFTVSLVPAAAGATSVDLDTMDGSATAGSDYTAVSTTVNFAAGVTSQQVVVPVLGDTLDEPDETFTAELSNPVGGPTVGDPSGTGTIVDDDPTPTAVISDVAQVEGNAGNSAFTFDVSLSAASSFPIAIDFATADGTATTADADYVATAGTINFAPGQILQSIPVTVNGDGTVEPNETFTVNLSMPVNVTLADPQGEGTIVDDDGQPQATIDDDLQVEGDAGSTDAVFTVTLSIPPTVPVSLDFATADGTASAGTDYTSASGTLNFGVGVTIGQILVPILGDTLDEADETYVVDLLNPVGLGIADPQGLGTITDDDPEPQILVPPFMAPEGDAGNTTFDIPVTLSAASGLSVSVDWATLDGTATSGSGDYLPAMGTLTFLPGETSQIATILVGGDTLDEGDETLTIELTNPVNGQVTPETDQVTIQGDDGLGVIEIPTLGEWAMVLLVLLLMVLGVAHLRMPRAVR